MEEENSVISATLKYIVRGVRSSRESRGDLQNELTDNLTSSSAVTILPVVEGLAVEIEVDDIAPFSRTSFEPYVAEHVLPEAVRIRCEAEDPLQLQLIKAKFS